jgi:hypothetical protein
MNLLRFLLEIKIKTNVPYHSSYRIACTMYNVHSFSYVYFKVNGRVCIGCLFYVGYRMHKIPLPAITHTIKQVQPPPPPTLTPLQLPSDERRTGSY